MISIKIKILTISINIIVTLICTVLIAGSLIMASPWNNNFLHFNQGYHVNTDRFFTGIIITIISLLIPVSVNKILYHALIKKYYVNKLWFNIPAIITTSLSLIFIICNVLFTGIDKWIYAEWI